MMKLKNKKGFTLMEMLIVVAIIAVLIAIAIPTFTSSLNKARIATDEANIRSGYASTIAAVLTNDFDVEQNAGTKVTYALNVDGSVSEGTTGTYECLATNAKDTTVAGVTIDGGWTKGDVVTYIYSYDDNTVEIKCGN